MTIDNFEDHIEPKILDRGFDYYEQDYVRQVKQIATGEFTAKVMGSYPYNVYLRFDDKTVEMHTCSCPYEYGDVCKHIVAVLYYIADAEMLDEVIEILPTEDLQNILNAVSEAQLREFVLKYAKLNRSFRKDFLNRFGTNIHEDEEDI
jgi:uncharacterized Zn finger protein